MAPPTAALVSQLKQVIYYHLDCESADNANFIAARLHALDPRNPDAAHLLALTFLRLRQLQAAYDYAHKHGASGKHLGCSYVFALACEQLNRFHEGILALDRAKPLWVGRDNWNKHSETTRRHVPDAAAVHNLYGKLWRGHSDPRKHAEAFTEAHRLNPFIWDAFQGLCDIGTNINPSHAFCITPGMTAAVIPLLDPPVPRQPTVQPPNGSHNVLTPSSDPFNTNTKAPSEWNLKSRARSIFGSPPKVAKSMSWETPTNTNEDVEMGGMNSEFSAGAAPPPVRRTKTLSKLGFDVDKDSRLPPPPSKGQRLKVDQDDDASTIGPSTNLHKRTHSGHTSNGPSDTSANAPRRSNRLFHQVTGSRSSLRQQVDSFPPMKDGDNVMKVKATGTKGRGLSTVGRVVSGNRKVMPPGPGESKEHRAPSRNGTTAPPLPPLQKYTETIISSDTASIEYLLDILRKLGAAYYALSRYDTKTAIETLHSLPVAQQETPWVLAQIAKAYYWDADYVNAEMNFVRMRKAQPSRLQDVEIFSTVLWHLKKQVPLSFLAHNLKDLAFEAPQTWCAVGNAFSLSGEDEQAIACFKRATQIDPSFYYAWTLLGHQYLGTQEFEAAMKAFRRGIGRERRIYDGWYGLGKCYEQMGKLDEAVRHYQIAASINPGNAILFICIGAVLEKNKHTREALKQYTHALLLKPDFALARFKKAEALRKVGAYELAVEELELLKDSHPEEAIVFYHLGLCYKSLDDKAAAVKCFTTAISLDAKDSQYIREAMESLDDDEEIDDE